MQLDTSLLRSFLESRNQQCSCQAKNTREKGDLAGECQRVHKAFQNTSTVSSQPPVTQAQQNCPFPEHEGLRTEGSRASRTKDRRVPQNVHSACPGSLSKPQSKFNHGSVLLRDIKPCYRNCEGQQSSSKGFFIREESIYSFLMP